MSGGPSEPSNEPSLHGAWLQSERTRLALSRPALAKHLGISASHITGIETRRQPVPSEWYETLRDLGFRVPSTDLVGQSDTPELPSALQDTASLLPQHAASLLPSASAEERGAAKTARAHDETPDAKQNLTGAWLRSFCRDNSLSLSQISDCLDVPFKTVLYYEQHDRPLPAWWVKKIQPLAREQSDSTDPVKVIVDYRLRLGRLASQSAVEVMAWIAHDLRASGAEESVTYDQLEAAMEGLLTQRRRRGP